MPNNCYSIKTFLQLEQLVKTNKNKRKKLVLYVESYLIKGFGINWLSTLIKLVKKKYSEYNIKFYIDSGNDHGLSILLLRENIDYLKLKSNKIVMNKISEIAKKNKVLLNPHFNVVQLSKIKNYNNLNL